MLSSGLAIAIENPWSQLNGNSVNMELATGLDTSNAATFDLLSTEEGTFTFQADMGSYGVATALPWQGRCPVFLLFGHSWAKGEKKRSYSQWRQGLDNWSSNGFRYLVNGSGSGDVQVR